MLATTHEVRSYYLHGERWNVPSPSYCPRGPFASKADFDALKAKTLCIDSSSDANDLYFSGCDVHVENGGVAESTSDINGKGNLIIGYHEEDAISSDGTTITGGTAWSGSHNIIVGPGHSYSAHTGIVVGAANSITGDYSSVTGGYENSASKYAPSVSGGHKNSATGIGSSVVAGMNNDAAGEDSSVTGGFFNKAGGRYSCVIAGEQNEANGESSSVTGGTNNKVSGRSTVYVGDYT
mmetsp:Transcript_22411/g.32100  ORF Transcript_22411/g.32100 Transcript_22411/m.32100 type:complete len:237 (-) Transcript_22411:336-1046(-)